MFRGILCFSSTHIVPISLILKCTNNQLAFGLLFETVIYVVVHVHDQCVTCYDNPDSVMNPALSISGDTRVV